MNTIESAGGTVVYRQADVMNDEAVLALVQEIVDQSDKIDVLIHAAGLERSHFLADKPPQEFNLVFDVKADGFFNLLKAIHTTGCPLGSSVVFTSIAGRFGNGGQTDYSAANDLLCKITSAMRSTHPDTKAIATDWSAWGKVGMATRGSIPEMMRRAGIDMLDPEVTVPVVRREIVTAGTGGEVLIAGALGILLDPRSPDGGIDLDRANKALAHKYPVAGQLTGVDAYRGFTFQAELDPTVEPFLHDHALDETPLLPGVMGVEGFAEVASLIASGLGSSPDLSVHAIEGVRFVAPLKFYRNEPRTLTWHAVVMPTDEGLLVDVELESARETKAGTQVNKHFFGRVHLAPRGDGEQPKAQAPEWGDGTTLEPPAIYDVYFHGPAFQVLGGAQASEERVVGQFQAKLPQMMGKDKETLVAPLWIELCLQTAGVWEIGLSGVMALPTAIDQVVVHAPVPIAKQANGAVYAEITPRTCAEDGLCFDARVMDEKGNLYLELEGYRTAKLPSSVEEALVAPIRELVGGTSS